MTSVLTKLWRGQYSLPMAFLGFFIFGSWAATLVAFLVVVVFAQLPAVFMLGVSLSALILTAYWLLASVGVWRSAAKSIVSDNWVSQVEGYLARGVVLLLNFYFAWSFFNYGFVKVMLGMFVPL